MTRFLHKLSLVLVAAFVVFNVAARALGTLQPPNPALAGFTEGCEGKPQPCWYGIVPGMTSVEEAERLLEQADVRVREYRVNLTGVIHGDGALLCAFELRNDGQVITSVQVRYCPEDKIMLGAFLLIWGTPLGARYSINPLRGAHVIFQGTTILVGGLDSPFEPVQRWVIFPSDVKLPITNHWLGFIPAWRYCQLEPDVSPCSSPLLP